MTKPNVSIIKDVSEDFKRFANSFSRTNYVVWFKAISFNIADNKDLSINVLKALGNQLERKENINGKIFETNWNNIERKIEEFFSYTGFSGGYVGHDSSLVKHRKKIFLYLISKYINIPAEKVYYHDPDVGSYFSDYVMWGFCYMLVKGNKGLLISGGSSD